MVRRLNFFSKSVSLSLSLSLSLSHSLHTHTHTHTHTPLHLLSVKILPLSTISMYENRHSDASNLASAQAWCTGKTQRNQVEREVGGGIGMGIHVTPWLIHVNVWQNPLQYCKEISLQPIKINGKKKEIKKKKKRHSASKEFIWFRSLLGG